MKKMIFLSLFLTTISLFAQVKQGTLFIKYDKTMKIVEAKSEVIVSFSVFPAKDDRVSTFNFKIDNLSKEFKSLSFEEIKESISIKDISKILTLKDLSKLTSCQLHLKLSGDDKLVLIKKVGDIYYKYNLIYWSTQRGWEKMKM